MFTGMTALRIASILGFLAVVFGAFGAHALKGTLVQSGTMDIWQTGTLYHLVNAVVLLAIALQLSGSRQMEPPLVFWLFAAGTVLFSGSLYILALTGAKWVWPLTPLGGIFMLAGWLILAIRGLR